MDTTFLSPTQWSDRLAFDIALMLEGSGELLDEIKARHNLKTRTLLAFSKDPVFGKRVEHYREEVRTKGLTFRLKARAQAEELLRTSWMLIHNDDVSAAVRADLIKSTVKWAGLEVRPDEDNNLSAGGVQINISFGGTPAPLTVEAGDDDIETETETETGGIGSTGRLTIR